MTATANVKQKRPAAVGVTMRSAPNRFNRRPCVQPDRLPCGCMRAGALRRRGGTRTTCLPFAQLAGDDHLAGGRMDTGHPFAGERPRHNDHPSSEAPASQTEVSHARAKPHQFRGRDRFNSGYLLGRDAHSMAVQPRAGPSGARLDREVNSQHCTTVLASGQLD